MSEQLGKCINAAHSDEAHIKYGNCVEWKPVPSAAEVTSEQDCPDCGGHGVDRESAGNPCDTCSGRGILPSAAEVGERDAALENISHIRKTDNQKMREKVTAFASQQVEERTEECCKETCWLCRAGSEVKIEADAGGDYMHGSLRCDASAIRQRFGKG